MKGQAQRLCALLLAPLLLAGCGGTPASPTGGGTVTTTSAATGDLQVETSPGGANVFLDGVLQGQSPLTIEHLPASATYLVRAEKEGFSPAEAEVTVSADQVTTLSLTLAPKEPGGEIQPPF